MTGEVDHWWDGITMILIAAIATMLLYLLIPYVMGRIPVDHYWIDYCRNNTCNFVQWGAEV